MSAKDKPLATMPMDCCIPALQPRLELPEARELAKVFKALADPTRVQIISLLLQAGKTGVCVCDIGGDFPLGQPTISHHLKVLKDASLVRAEKKGLWVFYSVNRDLLAQLGIALTPPQENTRLPKSSNNACGCYPDGEKVR